VRIAASHKLNDFSLNEVCNQNKDLAVILALKIRFNQTKSSYEFEKASTAISSLSDVLGAAAFVNDPLPSSYDVVLACHKYIRQWDVSRIPEINSLLIRFLDVLLTEDYLNCENDELYSAGAQWVDSHDYNIVR